MAVSQVPKKLQLMITYPAISIPEMRSMGNGTGNTEVTPPIGYTIFAVIPQYTTKGNPIVSVWSESISGTNNRKIYATVNNRSSESSTDTATIGVIWKT